MFLVLLVFTTRVPSNKHGLGEPNVVLDVVEVLVDYFVYSLCLTLFAGLLIFLARVTVNISTVASILEDKVASGQLQPRAHLIILH